MLRQQIREHVEQRNEFASKGLGPMMEAAVLSALSRIQRRG